MKIILLIMTMTMLQSCSKGGGDGVNAAGALDIHYIDSAGNELFTNGANGYIKDSLMVYDYKNPSGISITTNWQWTNFVFQKSSSSIRISDRFNSSVGGQYIYGIIHLKKGVDDTLKLHEIHNGSSLYHDSAWYNGVLKLPKDSFTIKK